jgi:hypothetical protein
MLLLIECGLLLAAIAGAMLFPGAWDRWFVPPERAIAKLALRRNLCVILVGGSAMAIRLLLLPLMPIPVPAVHDEFSYLLMADTFAHGRVTNPTHPMWKHFETFHEIQKPTYASMYYPAQGAFLAFGQIAFGHPFWGVWLSTGLMCGAICWMLQGWAPPFWALVGGLLAVIRIGTVSYWANSYWGGAVTALGGALVLGALPRLKRTWSIRNALLMGLGFSLVALSRPYESVFFALPVLAILLVYMRSSQQPATILVKRTVVPLLAVLFATVGAMGYYFRQITGSALRPPFFENLATYNPIPYFPWQKIGPLPVYDHVEMKNFYLDWWQPLYLFDRAHPIVSLMVKLFEFGLFYLGPLFAVVILAGSLTIPYGSSFSHRRRSTRFMLLVLGSVLLGAALPVYFNSHYVAAATSAVYLLIVAAMQRLRRWQPFGSHEGRALIRLLCVTAVLMFIVRVFTPATRISVSTALATWCSPTISHTSRNDIRRELLSQAGKQLVIVHYKKDHVPIDEWVFNDADIDGSKVIWARDMGKEANAELVRYFQDRRVWTIDPDQSHPMLATYSDWPTSSTAAQ